MSVRMTFVCHALEIRPRLRGPLCVGVYCKTVSPVRIIRSHQERGQFLKILFLTALLLCSPLHCCWIFLSLCNMADLIVSPVVNLVKQQVVAYLQDQYELHSGVSGKLKKLEAVLDRILATADTADEVDFKKHVHLEGWMRELKVAAEEANDVLDEFEYLRLERQAEGEGDGADDELHFCPPSCRCLKSFIRCGCFHFLELYAQRFIQYTGPLKRLSSVQSKLEELQSSAGQFVQLVADRKATDREHDGRKRYGRETSSRVVEHGLVGRKEKLEEIINKLVEEKPVSDGGLVPVLALVGHGGSGKTTLAQYVFNDSTVAKHFKVRMWAYVSQDFHVPTIIRRMIESADRKQNCSDTESLESLQQKLKKILMSKKFLLVLDDVWYSIDMEEEWNKLCGPLAEFGEKGSKILLTSRIPEVEKLTGSLTPSISLQELTQDDCWSIIQKSAFRGSGIPDGYGDLVDIGRKIALRVYGSPLAAKAVGGTLRKDLSWRHWSDILNSELPGNNVMAVLRLSYQYLPPYLRQCFAYCSLFPKGHYFDVDMLVRMWVAHGYIRDRQTTEEDLDDLLSAGFFTRQRVNDYQSYVVMHDLMNDLARFVSKDEFLRIEDTLLLQDSFIPDTVRHLSVRTDCLAELIKKRCNLSNLKTFLLLPSGDGSAELDDKLVKDKLQQLRRVRVLDLHGCKVKELPDDIGDWVHLRYLDLSSTEIGSLPQSLWRLYQLQVLCTSKAPIGSSSLDKLNHLVKLRFVSSRHPLKLAWIRGLESLQVLRGTLDVERGRGSEISNLKALNELQESLNLAGLDYVESGAAAHEADLCAKKRLQELQLMWNYRSSRSSNGDLEVLQALQPPSSLEGLQIYYYAGVLCPNWMGNQWLANLRYIHLEYLFHLESLPPLGQLPLLESLELIYLPKVRKLSQEGFPSLKSLVIEKMNELEEWTGPDTSGGLPCLEVFTIFYCPNLRTLPTISPTVKYLKIEYVGISFLPDYCVDEGIATSSTSPSNLSRLRIECCGNLISLGKGFLQNQQRLRELEEVTICGCPLLESLPDVGFRELMSLKSLVITNCPNLTWVTPAAQDVDCGLLPSSLQEFHVSHIGDEAISRCLRGGLNSLSKLSMAVCPLLKSMPSPDEMANLTSLQELEFLSCKALTPTGLNGLRGLHSLKLLMITRCPGLLVEASSTSAAEDDECMATEPFSLAIERLEIDDRLMLINVPVLKSPTSIKEVAINDDPIYFEEYE